MTRLSANGLEFSEGTGRLQAQAAVGKVHVVESFKRFGAERHALTFPREREKLYNRDIGDEHCRQANDGAGSSVSR